MSYQVNKKKEKLKEKKNRIIPQDLKYKSKETSEIDNFFKS